MALASFVRQNANRSTEKRRMPHERNYLEALLLTYRCVVRLTEATVNELPFEVWAEGESYGHPTSEVAARFRYLQDALVWADQPENAPMVVCLRSILLDTVQVWPRNKAVRS